VHGLHIGSDRLSHLNPTQVKCEEAALDHVRETYINSAHPVFDLVPGPFGEAINRVYSNLGRPAVTRQSVWEVYLQLFGTLRVLDALPQMITVTTIDTDNRGLLLPLLADHEDLPMVEARDGIERWWSAQGRSSPEEREKESCSVTSVVWQATIYSMYL